MSQAMGCRPSVLAGITEEWMSYFWDEMVFKVSRFDLGEKKTKPKKEDSFGAYG